MRSMHRRDLPSQIHNLQLSRLHNGRLLVVLDLTTVITGSLKSLDNGERRIISDLAEDNVLSIEPAGDDGGDEELGAVAVETTISLKAEKKGLRCLRVGTSVGHGEKTRLGVLADEVLIGELLTVDGLATGALEHG